MTKLHRKTTDDRLYAPTADAFMPSERERHMAQFHVGYDGRRYHRNGYRYDRLEDAVAYARLVDSTPGRAETIGTYAQGDPLARPTDAEQALMVSLGIRFDEGAYRFESFRYDKLSDAVNYAKQQSPLQRDDRS
jgi:hypothetical protein